MSEASQTAANQKGIDVSHWQKIIDWNEVAKSGIKHVFMKMTDGAKFLDPFFVTNWNGAKAAKINVNCYHYFRALDCTPEQQLDNIRRILTGVEFDHTDSVLAIDVEAEGNQKATPEQMADNLKSLLDLISKDSVLKNRPPMIYTSSGYWDWEVKWDKYDFGVYPLWVAHWGVKNPRLPKSWKNWSWWQYSSKGKVDGIDGDVDLDWVIV